MFIRITLQAWNLGAEERASERTQLSLPPKTPVECAKLLLRNQQAFSFIRGSTPKANLAEFPKPACVPNPQGYLKKKKNRYFRVLPQTDNIRALLSHKGLRIHFLTALTFPR